jgi:malonate-semialdehyde dehydrogenase (acetylating) / methylmalonate-semialdehyde dehydrogenase
MIPNLPISPLHCPNIINTKAVEGSGELIEITSPYYGKVIGSFKGATQKEVDLAVRQASRAAKDWGQAPLKERTKIMFNVRELMLKKLPELSETISLESGKTKSEASAELMKGIEVLEFALSLQNLDLGGKMEVSRGVHCEYRREPLGVVASVTPFNFPAMVPMWTIPIALTLGNAYIWKPSEKTPLTSVMIANIFSEAGLPTGLFQVLQGDSTTVKAIIEHKDVKALAFVGSTKIAELLYQQTTALGKRALCLGGAKNHIVLLPDAKPEIAGPGISDSFTGCAGQRCMAASVLLAVGNVESHIKAIIERAQSLKLGEQMGALITPEQRDFLHESIERAVSEGATLLLDGRNPKMDSSLAQGYWLAPTILDNVKPGSFAATTELFGPILSIIRVESIHEAMEIENSVDYGNACSVFTSSGAHSEKVIARAKAGMIGVNIGVPVPREPFSFGGINASRFGHGDITGHQSIDFWTQLKKVTTKWESQLDQNWMS